MNVTNRLPIDEEKRRGALVNRGEWLRRMRTQDPHHARLFCQQHANYIGHRGVFPCHDCTQEGA